MRQHRTSGGGLRKERWTDNCSIGAEGRPEKNGHRVMPPERAGGEGRHLTGSQEQEGCVKNP